MKTKLVYVLTCAPEATYIEQALMAVFSTRHWNPDAHIVLMVDDKTDALLTGIRGEINSYISEKIVVPFEDETLTPMYRSRWIKTQIRQMIEGDFLFVDSDTICQRPLSDIDYFVNEVGAVLESHLPVRDFNDSLYKNAKELYKKIGVDIDEEQYYFSSGVLYVKDTKKTHQLYELWHQYWIDGLEKGLKIDQPSLAKANREIGHIIRQIPDSYNCILFTQPPFIRKAHILHIAAYQNPSFLFADRVLNYIKENGIENNEWLQHMILNSCATMMPFDYDLKHSTCRERSLWKREIAEAWKEYGINIDSTYADFPMSSRWKKYIVWLLRRGFVSTAVGLYLIWRRVRIKLPVKRNFCAR